MKRLTFILTAILLVAMQDALFAQHSLQINNASGVYGVIALPPGGTPGIYNYTLPQGGGTIVVDPGPGLPSSGWLTAGNTLVGGEKLGSLNNFDVSLVTNDMEILRLICTTGVNLNANMELRMNGDAGTSGYILQSNGPGANPSWVLNPGFAASGEPFLTFAADGGTLTNNRVLTAGSGIGFTNSGSDDGTLTIDNTGVLSNVAGTGISVSSATGDVTITNDGVLSITGTANQVLPVGPSTGNVTLSLPQDIHTGATPTFRS